MKKILIFMLAALVMIGCTACADSKDADTTGTVEISSEELYKQVHNGNIEYNDMMAYEAFKNDVVEKVCETVGADVTWDDIIVFIRVKPQEERYPCHILLPDNTQYNLLLEAGVISAQVDDTVTYCLEWSTPHHVYGKYFINDVIISAKSDTDMFACINKTKMLEALGKYPDLSDYNIKYGEIELFDNKITVPLYLDEKSALATVEIGNDLEYTVISVDVISEPLEYTYALSENDIPNYNGIIEDHQFHILGNGYIVRKCASLRVGDSQYYFQNIFDQNGAECELTQYIFDENGIQNQLREPYPKFYRVVIETDNGNIITATPNGKTVVYDKNWNVTNTADDIYYAAALDGGRYFVVNDEVNITLDMGHPSYYEPPEIYALYRYTEKLTECKYSSIVECDGGYECIYTDENGVQQSDIIYIDDKVAPIVPDIVPVYNEETQKYYLADKSGVKIIDDEFDYISNVAHNRAVVLVEDKFYILDLIVS